MAPNAALTIAIALTAQGPTTDSVVLRSVVTATSGVSFEEAEAVERFLADRIGETWGVPVGSTPPIASDGRRFDITLRWQSRERVEVEVAEPDLVHMNRPITIADPESGRAIVWLSIRSSVERALAMMPPAPTFAEIVAEPEEPAPEPTPPAAPIEPAVNATVVEPIAGEEEQVYDHFASLLARRQRPEEGTWSGSVLVRGGVDGGLSMGPSAQVHYVTGRWLTVGAELGFHSVSPAVGLSALRIPLSVMGSTQPDLSFPLELGVRTTFDFQITETVGQGSAVRPRLLVGPFARSSVPFYVGTTDQASFVAEMRFDFSAVRGSYRWAGGGYTDPLFGATLAVGVEYRWR